MKITTAPRYHRFAALHALRALLPALATVALFAALAFAPAGVTPVRAAGTTYVVTSTADGVNDANCAVGSCTLRQAVNASNANDPGAGNANTITFGPAFAAAQTITLLASSGGTLTPSRSVTIDATTVGNRAVTISGNNLVRLFSVNDGGVTLGLTGLTLTKGNPNENTFGGAISSRGTVNITNSTVTDNQANGGGAIENLGGTVTITGSTVSNNQAGQGGAIDNQLATLNVTNSIFSGNQSRGSSGGAILNNGTATITGSTFTGNTTTGNGGAIYNESSLTVTNSTFNGNQAGFGYMYTGEGGAIYGGESITGSTFTGNHAGYWGGAISGRGGLNLTLSVIAGNTADQAGADLSNYGPLTSGGGNVVGATHDTSQGTQVDVGGFGPSDHTNVSNPGLGPLGNYGGPVQTYALLPGSLAIDILACPSRLTTDARGYTRPQGTKCDAGAFESRGFAATITAGNNQRTLINTQFGSGASLTVSSANSEPVAGGQVTFTITPGMSGASAVFGGGCTNTSATVSVCALSGNGAATSPTFTANGTTGTFTIVATATGMTTTTFTETILATAMPQTYVVTRTADDVNDANCTMASCTLRQAVNASNGNNPGTQTNTITFDATFSSTQTITLSNASGGTLVAGVNVTIDATVSNRAVTISGNNAVQLFVVNGGVTLGLHGLTLANGTSGGGSTYGHGGAIDNNGTVNITASTFTGSSAGNGGAINNNGTANISVSTFTGNNNAVFGGAIYNGGTANVTNSTFSGNSANSPNGGGAIYNSGTANITGSTLTGNHAGFGGAIANGGASADGTLRLALSVVAGNTVTGGGPDIWSSVTSGGGNVIGTTNGTGGFGASDRTGGAVLLGSLGNYGGPVQTIPLLPGSPAIDIAACPTDPITNATLATDARGISRPQGTNCDAGSFESRGFAAGMVTGSSQTAKVTTAFGSALSLTVSDTNNEPVQGGQVTFTITPNMGASATFTGTPPVGCTLSAMNTVAVCTIPMSGTVTSPTFTANGTTGGFTIVATAGGVPTTTFTETNSPPTLQTYVVTSAADDVNDANCMGTSCTLRQAVNASNANNPGTQTNTITFSDTFSSPQTITLLAASGGRLTVIGNVTIDATAGNRAVTISGGGAVGPSGVASGVGLFGVNSGVTLGLHGLTLANGSTRYGGNGGGIVNNGTVNITASTFSGNYAPRNGSNGGAIDNSGTANITGSTFSGNSASYGGAINNGGTANITNSTFSGNGATFLDGGRGGAIINNNGATLTVTGSTFTGNHADRGTNSNAGYGGAIYNDNVNGGTSRLTLALSIIAGNSADGDPDLHGYVTTDGGGNVIGGNALLGTLGNYGGPVQTIPLLPGSPAINIAACPLDPIAGMTLATDARGVSRPQGTNCDAGAFESRGFTAGTLTGDGQSAAINTAFGSAVGFPVSSANNEPVAGGQVTFTITPNMGASAVFGTAPVGCTNTSATVSVCTIPMGGTVTSPTFTAKGTAGNFTIVATAIGLQTTTFTETNTPPVHQTYVVTSTADDVNDANCTPMSCTLRQAVNLSNTYDPGAGLTNTITFSATFSSAQTITLSNASGFGTLTLTKGVTIDATVGNRAVTISGNNAVQLFAVNSGVTLGLSGLTLANGNASTAGNAVGNAGGAVNNASGGTVNVTGSTFTGNHASVRGGAIANNGTLQVTNSTFSGNVATSATSRGGAIANSSGTATVTGSTFTSNQSSSGGAIFINTANHATLTLALSVVTGNTATGTTSPIGPDIANAVTSGGGNVIGDTTGTGGFVASDKQNVNALLGTLGNYGGPVQTIPLLPGSPAINILACPTGLTSDARGVSRPQGTNCDAGSFESQDFTAGTATGNNQSAPINTAFGSAVGFTVSSANSEPVGGGQVKFTITPDMGASATFTGTPPMGCTLSAMNTVAVCTVSGNGTVTSPTFTANGTTGGFTIVASANGVPPTNFAETNTGAGTAPAAVADSYTAAVNTTLTVPAATGVLANDTLGTPAATITASTQPTHGIVTLSTGDGSFTYTPTAGYTGSDSFTYTLTNSVGVSTATVNLTVTGTAPTAMNDTYVVAANTALTVAAATGVLANDTRGNPAATITGNTMPMHGTLMLNATDGSFTYTPTAGYTGNDSFQYTLTNAVSGSTGTVSLTVNPAPATHFAVTGFPSSVAAGVSGTVTVTAQDAGGNTVTGYTGTVAITSSDPRAVLPPNATLSGGVGTFAVTLKTAGTQSITATDTVTASISGTQTGITVTGSAPTAMNDSYTVAMNTTLTVPAATGVLANDILGTPPATITANTQPAHGMLTLNTGDGSFGYTPTAGYTGNDSFQYTLTNAVSGSTGTVSITVQAGTLTTTSLAISPSPAAHGSPVTLAATVAPATATGLPAPTGTVAFADGGAPLATVALVGGTASFSTSGLTVGVHHLSATYTPASPGPYATSQGTQDVTITPAALVSIAVTPATATLKVGQQQQFTATGTYADGSAADLTGAVAWSSDATAVESVDATGKATGQTPGTAHIKATQGTMSGQATVTVTPPTATGITVPPAPSGRASGTTSGSGAPNPAPGGRPASGGGTPVAAPTGR